MSDITLTSSIRSNLLSLQNASKLLDLTSERLSTGKKVNSALDNPSAFFTARGLTNRAGDLDGRKNSMGQAISLLTATDKAINSITNLVEQAKATAQSAEEASTSNLTKITSATAKFVETGGNGVSTVSSKAAAALTVGSTMITTAFGITDGDDFVIDIDGVAKAVTIGTAATTTVDTLVSDINTALAGTGVSAVYNSATLKIDITATNSNGTDIAIDAAGITALTFTDSDATAITGATTYTFDNGAAVVATDTLDAVFGSGIVSTDNLTFSVTGGGSVTEVITSATSTIQDVLDAINAADSALTATFNATTSKIEVAASDGVELTVTAVGGSTTFDGIGFTDGTTAILDATGVTYGAAGSEAEVGTLNSDFQGILEQIDKLISDSSYKGINLLKGSNSSTVKFNAAGTTSLTIDGLDLGVTGNTNFNFTLDASGYDFTSAGGIAQALTDTDGAISSLRSISATFGADLGVIQTREDFTNELVNVLEDGAGKLVNANLELESANMLALQTRQALGIQALSISNQSNQSILSLFR